MGDYYNVASGPVLNDVIDRVDTDIQDDWAIAGPLFVNGTTFYQPLVKYAVAQENFVVTNIKKPLG